ncbi:MAG: leucine--tRNA ligase [Flavobacteriales bacterium]|nr:leucine--tRNA ligase [Flavobacteriales bacterium]
MDYKFNEIEKKWSKIWIVQKTYRVTEDPTKKKFYVLDMFPYPSGAGLHVGHPLGYIASDIYARYKRLNGYNVLHPMGYDSFGLPAEQYAIETGQHPEITTKKNITKYREQLDKIGFSFDWEREIQTSNPSYYKWTQWIFKQLFNSYYCNIDDRALPISELIEEFKRNGNAKVKSPCDKDTPVFNALEWASWDEKKQQDMLLKYRLAYLSDTWVNWCEGLGTVLANDEVKDGYSERGNFPVEQKKMKQWSLRITAYAERLLTDLNSIDWSESIKEIQKNWIGKSEGASIHFQIFDNLSNSIEVFTTRPDTIYGVSFIVLAPEHDLIKKITCPQNKLLVNDYCQQMKLKSEKDRQLNTKNISGVFSGAYAIHPFTNKKIPIWISEYVLGSYGTGAIMAVPCGDQRDWDFAQKFNLDKPNIFDNTDINQGACIDKSVTIKNSDFLNKLKVPEAIQVAINAIEKNKLGTRKINYKIRDAIFSRQRYWGEPFPVYYKQNIPYLIEEDTCIQLPPITKYLPAENGDPPLARAKQDDWNIFKGDRMEFNTMPGWAGSSWYFLRFMDPNNNHEFVNKEKVNYWKQVDLYIGGAEHAVGHLLYSRFWTKFLFDKGFIDFNEPFKKLINQGMILGRSSFVYRIKNSNKFVTLEKKDQYETSKIHVDIECVDNDILNIEKFKNWRAEYNNAEFILNKENNYVCDYEIEKMSKSKYNTQNPDDLINKFGADTLRMYEMFLGPLEQFKPWDIKGINGVHNFLKKVWRFVHNNKLSSSKPNSGEYKIIHTCIKKVTQDLNRYSFNTVVSHLMICLNDLSKIKCNKKEIINLFIILLSPYAPFISAEIWQKLGNKNLINDAKWPVHDNMYLLENTSTYAVSFNGKVRFTIKLDKGLKKEDIQSLVLKHPKTENYLKSQKVNRVIVVPNKIINVVFGKN